MSSLSSLPKTIQLLVVIETPELRQSVRVEPTAVRLSFSKCAEDQAGCRWLLETRRVETLFWARPFCEQEYTSINSQGRKTCHHGLLFARGCLVRVQSTVRLACLPDDWATKVIPSSHSAHTPFEKTLRVP
eukprot:2696569-Amphidinium_carterae.1